MLLNANELGFEPWDIALLFVLYELCGVVTNIVAGVVGSRFGLKKVSRLSEAKYHSYDTRLVLYVAILWTGVNCRVGSPACKPAGAEFLGSRMA